MYTRKYDTIMASAIAEMINTKIQHMENMQDFFISDFSTINDIQEYTVLFFSHTINSKFGLQEYKDFDLSVFNKFHNILLITEGEIGKKLTCPCIYSKNPRLDFIKILNTFFVKQKATGIHPTAIIDNSVKLGGNVSIGAHSVITGNVTIGDDTTILKNVIIDGSVSIGKKCVIKSNTTIGSEGFSFVYNKGELEHFPQIGRIVISDGVWVGSNVSIEHATLDTTFIGENTKIDDLVQIGHNTRIGKACQITAGCIICGKAVLEDGCWIAPNSVIDNNIVVGKNALVGTGSVVRNNVEANTVVAGVPAKLLRKGV